MSGSLEIHGRIENWTSIKTFLFGGESDKESTPAGSKDDEDNWAWNDDEDEGESPWKAPVNSQTAKSSGGSGKEKDVDGWTKDCVIAVSPMADVLVIAKDERAVILTCEWDSRANSKYTKSFEGKISVEGEKITSVLCVPLVSKKKSSPGVPDWSCIVFGFSDGYVRMYTEHGNLLISQMFHDQQVHSMKCRSYQPATTAMEHDQLEEIFILYDTVLVTMDGFGLFQTLRACRNHVARLQANATEAVLDPPPLSYKKWEYDGQGVKDCESIGLQTPTTFDHMLTASIHGGMKARLNKVPFTSNVFSTVGDKPYASFHYAQEGQAVPMIAEIAYAMASKLKSSLLNAATGWLGFGGSPVVKQPAPNAKPEKPKIEPATPMAARFGLPDKQRKGTSVAISPCRKLLAITDTLARVVLIDVERGIAVRMWKGYRDAQCAWLLVDDDMSSKTKASGRKALFLVIYAPRKGQIEVFAMQQGPKVATFPVKKNGRLLSLSYGMMGLNNIPLKGGNKPVLQCVFLDPEAQLYVLNVPFHLALCDNNNSKLKDMHLLKTLQRMLRETTYTAEDVNDIVYDIKTQSMINQAFKLLAHSCKKLDVLTTVLEKYLEKFCDDESKDLSVIFRLQSLLQLYSFLLKSTQMPPPYSSAGNGAGTSTHDNTVLLCLHATEKEIKLIKDIANKDVFNKSPSKVVSFADESQFLPVNQFMASFNIEYDSAKFKSPSSSSGKLTLNSKSENLDKLGKLLLSGCFNNSLDLKEWKKLVKNCDLVPRELLQLTLHFWCKHGLMSSSFIGLMERLYHALKTICEMEGLQGRKDTTDGIAWWENIRKEIANSPELFYIYTFTIVCRAVSIDLQQDEQLKISAEKKSRTNPGTVEVDSCDNRMEADEPATEDDDDDEGWENVSLDSIRWNILLKQIEDLSFLSTILAQRPRLANPTLPLLPHRQEELSVVSLLEKGKGCIAEMVGRWLTTIGIDPTLIVEVQELSEREPTPPAPELTDKELRRAQQLSLANEADSPASDKMETDEEAESSSNANSEISYILELVRCLKDNFKVSLNSSIILANYCWEYCLEWNKDVEKVEYLTAAVSCVTAVPSNFIRQGLLSMMWSTFMSKQLANIASKGKLGKDKLVEKVSGISSTENKEVFLKACVNFLEEFMETNVLCEGAGGTALQTRKSVPTSSRRKSHWTNDTSSASLTDLAEQQPHANYEMILLHYQLSLVALFSQALTIKKASMRPMNLFDTKARMMFFSVLNSPAPYSNVEVDLALKVLREEYLCLAITNAIYAIPEELNDENAGNDLVSIVPSEEGVKQCEYWTHKCFELGKAWALDIDSLRINQVCEYYSCGLDLLGLETIGTVTARDILGSKLLVIAGMRLNYVIQTNRKDSIEIVSALSTNLSNWLNKLNYSMLRSLRFPKTSITELAKQIVLLLPDSNYDYKLAEELLHCSSFLC